MAKIIIAYFTTALVFLAIDYVWLTQVATRFYFDRIGHLLMEKPNLAAAGLFYILYVVGIVIFAGSLYVMTLTGIRMLGAVTPFGGLAFLTGCLPAWQAYRLSLQDGLDANG